MDINCNFLTKSNYEDNIIQEQLEDSILTKYSHTFNESNMLYFHTKNMILYSNGFFKFLARYSGRRRSNLKHIKLFITHIICCLVIFSLFNVSEACSSRTIPKPRPPPTPTPRPNITFHTYPCPELYDRYYCQNGGKCFVIKIASDIIYNCECVEGFAGSQCEYKEIDSSFLPIRPKTMLETASIASGATLAVIASFIFFCVLYMRYQQRQKLNSLETSTTNSTTVVGADVVDLGVDTVDGVITTTIIKCEHNGRRPFGPHHYQTLPMTATLNR